MVIMECSVPSFKEQRGKETLPLWVEGKNIKTKLEKAAFL